ITMTRSGKWICQRAMRKEKRKKKVKGKNNGHKRRLVLFDSCLLLPSSRFQISRNSIILLHDDQRVTLIFAQSSSQREGRKRRREKRKEKRYNKEPKKQSNNSNFKLNAKQ